MTQTGIYVDILGKILGTLVPLFSLGTDYPIGTVQPRNKGHNNSKRTNLFRVKLGV